MTSNENPRPCRKRICFARSAADAGSEPKRLRHASRARSSSVARAAVAIRAIAAPLTPFARRSCSMRAAPNFRASVCARASA
jgi:hypothetical protein